MTSSLLKSDNIVNSAYDEAEHFLLTALNALSAHVAILDEMGQILEVNTAWRQYAQDNGFTGADYGIGMNYLAVCERATNREARQVGQGIRDVVGHRLDEYYLEYPCHSPTERRWYVVRVTRFDWYGHVRVIVAHQNVTELKQVQLQLAESKSQLEAILDTVVNGIITVDHRGVIQTVNRAMTQIFGYETAEMIGRKLSVLMADPNPYQDADQFGDLVASSEEGCEIEGRRKDGSSFPLYIALSRMALDKHTLYTGIVQDITTRKQLEAERLETERLAVALEKEREIRQLKNRYISMMSHELKTPLASIRLASDFIKRYDDRATPDEKAESIATIEAQVAYLSEIVNDVTTLSKTEFMGEELELEYFDLETFLRDVLEEFIWTYRASHQLIYEGVDRRVEAQFDRKLLRRAITNLVSNAIKYSPEGGEIHLSLAVEKGMATIRLSDAGIGIPPEDMPRLFDAFHRAVNVGKLPGTGLGLAIARQAIELHGGTISVESELGKGTTFLITLPLMQE